MSKNVMDFGYDHIIGYYPCSITLGDILEFYNSSGQDTDANADTEADADADTDSRQQT